MRIVLRPTPSGTYVDLRYLRRMPLKIDRAKPAAALREPKSWNVVPPAARRLFARVSVCVSRAKHIPFFLATARTSNRVPIPSISQSLNLSISQSLNLSISQSLNLSRSISLFRLRYHHGLRRYRGIPLQSTCTNQTTRRSHREATRRFGSRDAQQECHASDHDRQRDSSRRTQDPRRSRARHLGRAVR